MSESFADFRREPSKPHQCMYYDDGRQCRAWSMHNEFFCYRHRLTPVQPVIENEPFEIAHLDSRPAIQHALADVAARLAANRMDLKRAGLLIYTLQLASNNLAAHGRAAAQGLAESTGIPAEPIMEVGAS